MFKKLRPLDYAIIVSVMYVAAQIFSDITSLRIIMFFGLSMDAGTLIYPITFTLRDLVHKALGVKVARLLVFLAAGINVFMAGLFWFVSILPADMSVGMQAEFGMVLSPVFRITLASIIAEVISELVDGQMYEVWVRRFGQKHQWGRVLVSNFVSVPVDSLMFVIVAFAGVLPLSVMVSIFLSNVVLKLAVSVVSIPGIYLVDGEV